jgi:uncharacterized membrane protein
MSELLKLSFIFVIGCGLGWLLEIFYRRIAHGKWINPGFLTGPYLPLYGTGLCTLYLMSKINISFIDNVIISKIVLVLFMAFAMTAIEYIAGIIFIKGMKVKLWDYSDRWGNVDGIICPLFSFIWGIIGAIYYFCINPYILDAISWFTNNLAYSYFIGYFFGVFTIDVINSMNLVVKLRKFANENNILVKFEELKLQIREEQEKRKEKIQYFLAFKSSQDLKEILEGYRNKHKFDKEKHNKIRLLLKKEKM